MALMADVFATALGETDRKALYRWHHGQRPRSAAKRRRLARSVLRQALPPAFFDEEALDAATEGLDELLIAFDGAVHSPGRLVILGWLVACSLALVLQHCGVRPLRKYGNGSVATAPHWAFATIKPAADGDAGAFRTETQHVKDSLRGGTGTATRTAWKEDLDGKVRHRIGGMLDGAKPQQKTERRFATQLGDPWLSVRLALEEVALRYNVNLVLRVYLLGLLTHVQEESPMLVSREDFLRALRLDLEEKELHLPRVLT